MSAGRTRTRPLRLPSIAEGEMAGWDRDMERVARLPDMFRKLAGWITRARANWTTEDFKPYVEHVVGLFGYERLMFGSDWPVCLMAGSYLDVVNALREALGPLREEDAANVWGETAQEFYQLA